MAIFFDAPVTPDALTTFVREVPADRSLGLLNQIPAREVDDNKVDFSELVRTNRVAKFRPYDGRIHVSERDTAGDTTVKLLPLSDSLNMGEYERLQVQFARTGGTNEQALVNAIYNDSEQLTREVQNRLELAWGDVLTDGKLTVDEGGYKGEADFGVAADHLVSAATAWTDTANANALSDLLTWYDKYVDDGNTGGVFRTSLRVTRLLQQNAEIVEAVHGTTGRTRVTREQLNDLLASEGLPTLAEPYDAQLSVDGSTTRTIPDDRLILAPADLGDLGFTAWGVSATALELVNSSVADLSFQEAAGIVGVVEKVGPPYRQFTFVDAVAMPIIAEPNRLFVADVA